VTRFARIACAGLALAALACLVPAAARAARRGAGPDTLSDSTWVDRWTLKNGLQVSVRHIPKGEAVAVVAAYRVGRDQDPKDREGMADLLCEVLFTAATSLEPERMRGQMDDLRPLGWNLQVAPSFSLVSEVTAPDKFPGVLRLIAARMRGVTVDDSTFQRARATALSEQGERNLGSPELMLFNRLRSSAQGVTDPQLTRLLAGAGLKAITLREARERLARLYVPANAALSLTGNLEGVDVHALVDHLFGDIPAGTAMVETKSDTLRGGGRVYRRGGLPRPMAGVAILAPALRDTLHPSFFLNALLIGQFCEQEWGRPMAPSTFRFRYPILADPQLVQFFPPVPPGGADPDQIGITFQDTIEKLASTVVPQESFDELRLEHQWMLGGPLTYDFLQRVRIHPGTLYTLASTMAVRSLWGSDEFWQKYLARFMDLHLAGGEVWTDYFQRPDRMMRVVLLPTGH